MVVMADESKSKAEREAGSAAPAPADATAPLVVKEAPLSDKWAGL